VKLGAQLSFWQPGGFPLLLVILILLLPARFLSARAPK